jgi:peptidoglycan/xylan/chitin deacetylase (PgdA/CDA1 family)
MKKTAVQVLNARDIRHAYRWLPTDVEHQLYINEQDEIVARVSVELLFDAQGVRSHKVYAAIIGKEARLFRSPDAARDAIEVYFAEPDSARWLREHP